MSEKPLSVAISALVNDGKILLIKRVRGDYVGFLGLPGGKVEKDEHLAQAAVREIKEESGIDSDFVAHLGLVSEHLVEDGEVKQHFLLHVCELSPKTTEVTVDDEGRLDWYPLDRIGELKDRIIPSDYLMIEKIVRNREGNYFECALEKHGEEHTLRFFR